MSLNLSYIFINIPNLKLECLFAAPQIALIFQYNRLSAKSKDLKFHPHDKRMNGYPLPIPFFLFFKFPKVLPNT